MSTRKTPTGKAKPGPSSTSSKPSTKPAAKPPDKKPVSTAPTKKPASTAPSVKPAQPPSPVGKIVVYKVTAPATTMRSARGSWFIGTLSKDDNFYHYFSDPTREGNWIWGYTLHRYGYLDGFGWVSLDDLDRVEQSPPHLDDSVRQKLQAPQKRMGKEFTSHFTHPDHRPTEKSEDAEWKVTIKKGVSVPFYINQRDGRPVPGQLHRTKPQLTSVDDGTKLKVRYLVLENRNLMVVNFDSPAPGKDGNWGFILKEGDNFTVDFK